MDGKPYTKFGVGGVGRIFLRVLDCVEFGYAAHDTDKPALDEETFPKL